MSDETCAMLSEIMRFRRVANPQIWENDLLSQRELRTRSAVYGEKTPSHPKLILYESMSGAKVMDSPVSMFWDIYKRSEFGDYVHVWSVQRDDVIPSDMATLENVIYVRRDTDAYVYMLSRAAYIISNSVLPEYFVRNPDQFYLNTWHGIGLKNLGRTSRNPLGAAASTYNMLQATHVLSPCAFMTNQHLHNFSMRNVSRAEIAEIGYPRIDATLNASRGEKADLRNQLRIDEDRPTLLYAPTWRGKKGRTTFDVEKLESDLAHLGSLNVNVIFLGHHLMLRHLSSLNQDGIVVPPASVNTNLLLSISDILITDYSSIFFDYLSTGRPIIHYLYDLEEYETARGLSMGVDDLPGTIVKTQAELVSAVERLIGSELQGNRYELSRLCFGPWDDGNASRRAVDWLFKGEKGGGRYIVPMQHQRSVVFWGGRLDQTDDSVRFVESARDRAEQGTEAVTLFVSHSVKRNDRVVEAINRLGDEVSVVARSDYEMAMTPDESAARAAMKHGKTRSVEIGQLQDSIYRREYRRIFGSARFDTVELFQNVSVFWERLSRHALR